MEVPTRNVFQGVVELRPPAVDSTKKAPVFAGAFCEREMVLALEAIEASVSIR